MRNIGDFNKELMDWDFSNLDSGDFLRFLSERNKLILSYTQPQNLNLHCKELFRNIAYADAQGIEYIAFHVGRPNQVSLCSLVGDISSNPNNLGVFFSFLPKDVQYYADIEENPDNMVYFLDLKASSNVRLQTNYTSAVISRYDLDEILKMTDEKDKSFKHAELNKKWVAENTVPFDLKDIADEMRKRNGWILVPDPVLVKY